MFPTITDLRSSAKIDEFIKRLPTSGDAVNIVIKPSNDDNKSSNPIDALGNRGTKAFEQSFAQADIKITKMMNAIDTTMSRMISKFNSLDVKLPANDRVDAYSSTMDRMLKNHNIRSRSWIGSNDDVNSPSILPGDVLKNHSAFDKTMDQMLKYNAHDREFTPNANDAGDNPIAVGSMNRIKNKHLVMPDVLPKAANDELPDENSSKRSRRKSQIELLYAIMRNTEDTSKSMKTLVDHFDELGVDSLRAREDQLESGNGNIDRAGNSDSRRAQNDDLRGKEKESSSLVKDLKSLAVGGAALAVGAVVDWWQGGDKPRGNESGETQQNPRDRSNNRRGGVVPTRVPNINDSSPITGDFTDREKAFIRMISKHEGAGYNTTFGAGSRHNFITPEKMYGKPLTELTIEEVNQYQDRLRQQP